MRIGLALLLCTIASWLPAAEPAPVFQYRVHIYTDDPATTKVTPEHYAYLWLPYSAVAVRGLLVCPTTDAEFTLVRHPTIRAACREAGVGIVWFTGGVGTLYDGRSTALPEAPVTALPAVPSADHRQVIDLALADLAAQSGYTEVAQAPWILFGHSTGALFARNMAYWRPQRTIALGYFKAGDLLRSPGAGWEALMPPTEQTVADRLAGVPIWGITGEYEEFGPGGADPRNDGTAWTSATDTMRADLLLLRGAGSPVGQLVDPGAGHHALNDGVIDALAALIEEVVPLRVGSAVADPDPVTLLPIAAATGHLADSQVEAPVHATAPVAGYAGPTDQAWWYPGAASAAAADALHADLRGGDHHFLDFTWPAPTGFATTNDPDATNAVNYAFQRGDMVPGSTGDGSLFQVQAQYRASLPLHFNLGELDAGNQAWGVSNRPIAFRTNAFAAFELVVQEDHDVAGQLRQATFRPRLDGWGVGWERLPGAAGKIHAIAPAGSAAGREWRRSERTLELQRFTPSGSVQSVVDPLVIDDRPLRRESIPLTTTFSSGLEPIHYVAYGPARVVDDGAGGQTLEFAEIPRFASFPIAIEVVAYQWGSANPPQFAPAETRTAFLLEAPEPPPNDDFADGIALDPAGTSFAGSLVAATRETGEPDHGPASVWWRWTPSGSGVATFELFDFQFDSRLSVYRGSGYGDLSLVVAADSGGNESVQWVIEPATTYHIAVTSADSGERIRVGTVAGTLSIAEPPQITSGPAADPDPVSGTTTTLTVGATDPDGDDAALVYAWTTLAKPPAADPPQLAEPTAASSQVTFRKAGAYRFEVVVTDADGLTASASCEVTVQQSGASVMVIKP